MRVSFGWPFVRVRCCACAVLCKPGHVERQCCAMLECHYAVALHELARRVCVADETTPFAGIRTVSAIETILEKDKFTLEELLDEDELLQECRAENQALLNL